MTVRLQLLVLAAACAIGSGLPAHSHADILPDGALVPILAPGATCSALNEETGLLAIGHKGQPHHLSLIQLSPNGTPGEARQVILPLPPSLQAAQCYPLGLAFHPKLPLLYVWRDVGEAAAGSAPVAAVLADFDHLVLLSPADATPVPSASFARGNDFAHGMDRGEIAIEPGGQRLYMPNLCDPALVDPAAKPPTDGSSIGFFDLDEAGQPVPIQMPLEGSLDGHGLNKFELRILPHRIHLGTYRVLPNGWGFAAPTTHSVIFSGYYGPAVWDTVNRRAALNYVYMPNMATCLIGEHPSLDVVYIARFDYELISSIRHADGYPTLLPRTRNAPGARFRSRPVAIAGKINAVIVGGIGAVHVYPVDAQGMLTGTAETVAVANPSVQTLAVSARHAKIYVPVETAPVETAP